MVSSLLEKQNTEVILKGGNKHFPLFCVIVLFFEIPISLSDASRFDCNSSRTTTYHIIF